MKIIVWGCLIAQMKRLDALITTQKTSTLCNVPLLKKSRKSPHPLFDLLQYFCVCSASHNLPMLEDRLKEKKFSPTKTLGSEKRADLFNQDFFSPTPTSYGSLCHCHARCDRGYPSNSLVIN